MWATSRGVTRQEHARLTSPLTWHQRGSWLFHGNIRCSSLPLLALITARSGRPVFTNRSAAEGENQNEQSQQLPLHLLMSLCKLCADDLMNACPAQCALPKTRCSLACFPQFTPSQASLGSLTLQISSWTVRQANDCSASDLFLGRATAQDVRVKLGWLLCGNLLQLPQGNHHLPQKNLIPYATPPQHSHLRSCLQPQAVSLATCCGAVSTQNRMRHKLVPIKFSPYWQGSICTDAIPMNAAKSLSAYQTA